MKKYYPILMVLFILGCKPSYNISDEAKEYINEAIQILQYNSINKNKIEWIEFKKSTFRKAKNAQSIPETYPAILHAIKLLGDNHSYFKPATKEKDSGQEKPLPVFEDVTVPKDIGYIRIPFCIGNEEKNNEYINRIHAKIENQNHVQLKGWIIDLRNNFGGNMWPMLISLEPILGNGVIGYFKYSNNQYSPWELKDGKVYLDSEVVLESPKFIKLESLNPIVAILTNEETASSGEAIAVAFKGRANTKSFGEKTYGVSTGCKSYTLSDGSRINLAESLFSDRNKVDYGLRINPDFESNEKETIRKAIDWIYKKQRTTANKVFLMF